MWKAFDGDLVEGVKVGRVEAVFNFIIINVDP